MAKLVPLLREGADDVERMLLASARQDGPPDTTARDRTLEALKAASGTAVVAGTGVAVGRWLSALKVSTSVSLAVGGIGLAAALGGAALVSGHASSGARRLSSAEHPAQTVAAVSPRSAQEPTVNEAPRVESPRATPGPAATTPPGHPAELRPHPSTTHAAGASREAARAEPVDPAVVSGLGHVVIAAPPPPETSRPAQEGPAPEMKASNPTPPASVAVPGSPQTSLRGEAALLEAVRESLAASQVDRALASLDDYDARFAPGALAEEAAVLRIEALLGAGRRAAADAKLAEFARRYPASSYGPRLRALAGKK